MEADVVFDYSALGLTQEDYLREMGYRKREPRQEVCEVIRRYERQFADGLKTSCSFVLAEGECLGDRIVLHGTDCLHVGTILGSLLAGAERFALFAATAGAAFQQCYDEAKGGGDMLRLFILDVMGTCIVERTGDLMEQRLADRIRPLRHTARFSPGYCGWPLTEQRDLFRLLGGHSCGIALSDVCLMHPLKSISGVIGIGRTVTERKYGCAICNLETCYKRKNKKKAV